MIEKNFTNAILLSGTILTVCMIVFPPLHLAAQNEVVIDEHIKVEKVSVESVDFKDNSLVVVFEKNDDIVLPVRTTASTTILLGNGDETQLPAIRSGMNVYLFGTYDKETGVVTADKIVIRNKRITERTSMSRAEAARNNFRAAPTITRTPPFEILGLTELSAR